MGKPKYYIARNNKFPGNKKSGKSQTTKKKIIIKEASDKKKMKERNVHISTDAPIDLLFSHLFHDLLSGQSFPPDPSICWGLFASSLS